MSESWLKYVGFFLVSLWIPCAAFAVTTGPTSNPYKSYPPSCLAYPLTDLPSGPELSGQIQLVDGIPVTANSATEDVTVTLWRVPCSGGLSAMLVRFDRSAANNGRSDVVPFVPSVLVTQGNVVQQLGRLSSEPNTFMSYTGAFTPMDFSETFVFENFGSPADTFIDFNQAVTITFVSPGLPNVSAAMPAYNPAEYPAASESIPLSGYLTGSYYDPAHSGEGIVLEGGEISATLRYIYLTWYTYDGNGIPYWISGLGTYTPGDRSVTISMLYTTGGGFAGNFSSTSVGRPPWGSVIVDFPDCNSLHFSYQADAGLPQGVPQGAGSKSWTRLSSINGLDCM